MNVYVWWGQEGVGVISNQLNAGVYCVDSSTTFIVHIMGSDSTCAGYLPSSDTIRVKFYDPNGIEEIAKTEVKVYPNPANSKITVTVSAGQGAIQLTIYNTLGEAISTTPINEYAELSVTDLPNGVYYYTATGNQTILAKGKLVVQH